MAACPSCGEPAAAGDNWCEACGADLNATPAVPCVACGEADIADDGYCMSCGRKQPSPRDRVEVFEATVAAISDRGKRHADNEDAVAVAALDGGAVLVVCDGVSSTPGSAAASLAGAEAARDALVAAIDPAVAAVGATAGGRGGGADGGLGPVAEEDLVAAVGAAQEAATRAGLEALPAEAGAARAAVAPSSTLVALAARTGVDPGDKLHLGLAWLGDSRAYWVDADQAVALTQDHELDGSLTRWLGADAAGLEPSVASFVVDRPGLAVVCSDGLWRYAKAANELHRLVIGLAATHPSLPELASALVAHANEGGGHDNISVALWAWPGPGQPSPEAESEPQAPEGGATEEQP